MYLVGESRALIGYKTLCSPHPTLNSRIARNGRIKMAAWITVYIIQDIPFSSKRGWNWFIYNLQHKYVQANLRHAHNVNTYWQTLSTSAAYLTTGLLTSLSSLLKHLSADSSDPLPLTDLQVCEKTRSTNTSSHDIQSTRMLMVFWRESAFSAQSVSPPTDSVVDSVLNG